MTNEVWKDIEGYEGRYQVSNMGRVKSLNYNHTGQERILKGVYNKGYLIVTLYKDGRGKHFLVHRLVAEAFIPNPENKPYIDHINTKKDSNRVDNLRWVTQEENQSNTLTKQHLSKAHKGKKNPMCGKTHSEETRRKMSEAKKGGENNNAKKVYCDGMIFDCVKSCSEYYDVKYATMLNWLTGKTNMPPRFKDLNLRYATEEDLKQVA